MTPDEREVAEHADWLTLRGSPLGAKIRLVLEQARRADALRREVEWWSKKYLAMFEPGAALADAAQPRCTCGTFDGPAPPPHAATCPLADAQRDAAPADDRCPYCSFDPTSLSDYCDKHRPRFR